MNDFIAGLVGGTAGLVVGHPLDTVKALMQTRNHTSIIASSKIVFRETKSKGFFRGLSMPFLAYGPTNSFLFGIYGSCLRHLDSENEKKKQPSLKYVFISGCIAGTLMCIPSTPLEVVKIQLQTHSQTEIKGLSDCIRKVYKADGVMGFFRGTRALIYRDSGSYGLYFFLFEFLRRKGTQQGFDSPIFVDLVCGGLAGSLAWLSIMPFDVIKSKIQADMNEKFSVKKMFMKIFNSDGLKGLFKGTSSVVIRGFIVNSVTLCIYIQTLHFLNEIQKTQEK